MRFDYDTKTVLVRETYAPLSDAGNRPPRVFFEVRSEGRRMVASPPGATIVCVWGEQAPHVTIRRTEDNAHIAEVMVLTPILGDFTEETIAIASALYWSWWRARDMHGEAHEHQLSEESQASLERGIADAKAGRISTLDDVDEQY